MHSFYPLLCTVVLFITSFSLSFISAKERIFNGWTHIELGAGNYGPDGHTKASQNMTILLKIKKISNKRSYIDDLDEIGKGDYKPEEQYGVLFWTLDELVRRYGDVGVFHVNDLYNEYAVFAAKKLNAYAVRKGYTSIIIEAVPGDYQLIDPKQTLSRYGKNKYSTAHLKNPEISFYHDRMNGDDLYTSDKSRAQSRLLLKRLSTLSKTGLYLFILYFDDFIPIEERTEFMEKNIFYKLTEEWDAVPYIFPEGNMLDKEIGKVFYIKNS